MRTLARVTVLVLFATLLPACAPAATTAPAATSKPAAAAPLPSPLAALVATPSKARDIACDLSDRVGPRLAGSPGDARAVAWAVAEMKSLGLANVHTEPVTVPHWERGPASATLLGDGIEQPLALTALGGSVATPKDGVEAEILEVSTVEALKKMPADVAKGKIVYFDAAMTRGRDAFKSYGETVEIRGAGPSEAARHGAIAAVIRSVGTSEARFPHTGVMRYADDAPKIPAAALAVPDAELISRLLAKGQTLRLRLSMETHDFGDAQSSDVVGEVRGREKPDEVVVIGAHLDAWDLGRGAIDDAAGVGVVLDMARAMLADPPKRTVRVVLFANEENGLMGSRAYAKAHAAELAKHQVVMETDAGAGRVFALQYNATAAAKPLFDGIGARLAGLGVSAPTAEPDAGGADTIPIRAQGVPSLELVQDGTRYFDLHHTADDTCDKIDRDDLAQVRDATLITAWSLAEAPALLERVPPPRPGNH